MDLTVLERLILLNVLPSEGDITTVRIMRELREALSFDEEEYERLQFQEQDGRMAWVDDGSTKDVTFGAKAHSLIVEQLTSLSDKGKLTEQHLPVCDKFGIGD